MLTRPLIVWDTETTGVDVEKDRIVQIAITKVAVDGKKLNISTLINPNMPIPPGATDVHGITDEMVKDASTFKDIAPRLLNFIKGCDFLGFNSNHYDNVLVFNEFVRAGLTWDYSDARFIDACNIFKRKEERTLSAAVKFYLGKDHDTAHSADGDVEATLDVFLKQMEMYEDLPKDLVALDKYCNFDKPRVDIGGKLTVDDQGEIIYNFGKNKGTRVKDDISYGMWMLKANFPADVQDILNKIIFTK